MNTDCPFCGRLNLYLRAKITVRERERTHREPTEHRVDELVELEFIGICQRLADHPRRTGKGRT